MHFSQAPISAEAKSGALAVAGSACPGNQTCASNSSPIVETAIVIGLPRKFIAIESKALASNNASTWASSRLGLIRPLRKRGVSCNK